MSNINDVNRKKSESLLRVPFIILDITDIIHCCTAHAY